MGEKTTVYVLAAIHLGPIIRRGDLRRLKSMLNFYGMRHDNSSAALVAASNIMSSVIGQRCLHHVTITKRTEHLLWRVTPADVMVDK